MWGNYWEGKVGENFNGKRESRFTNTHEKDEKYVLNANKDKTKGIDSA